MAYSNGIGSGRLIILGGNDILHGSNVDDDIFGDVALAVDNSVVFGGDVILEGNEGDDHLYGGGGDDQLMGEQVQTILFGVVMMKMYSLQIQVE